MNISFIFLILNLSTTQKKIVFLHSLLNNLIIVYENTENEYCNTSNCND